MARRASETERELRREQVLEGLLAGESGTAIARRLGINKKTALSDARTIREAWRDRRTEDFERFAIELVHRLNRLHQSVWQKALDGDMKAAALCVSISGELARLTGAYAPSKARIDVISREALERAVEERRAELRLLREGHAQEQRDRRQ